MHDTEAQTPELEDSAADEETRDEGTAVEPDRQAELLLQQDALARALAELENAQKRHTREREADQRYRVEPLARELLGFRDTLEDACRAMEQQGDDVPKALREGQTLLLRQLEQIFEKFGIDAIGPKGDAFDPKLHEAMTTLPSEEVAPGHVIEVVRRGYILHDRLLRPAQVVVASEAQPPETPESEDSA